MTKNNILPPIIEGMLERLKGPSSIHEKENLCLTLDAIANEIQRVVNMSRKQMESVRRKIPTRIK